MSDSDEYKSPVYEVKAVPVEKVFALYHSGWLPPLSCVENLEAHL